MDILKNKVIIISLFLLQVGIVSSAFATENIYKLDVFSVNLPSDPLWKTKVGANQIHVGRILDSNPIHTFTLTATEYPAAPEPITSISTLLLHISDAYKKEAITTGRYNLVDHTETTTNRLGLECVEYKKKYIDNGSTIVQNKTLIMRARGLICIHPNAANRLVEISYSFRNSTGIITETSSSEGIMFLNSLKALPIKSNKSLNLTGAKNAPPS